MKLAIAWLIVPVVFITLIALRRMDVVDFSDSFVCAAATLGYAMGLVVATLSVSDTKKVSPAN